MIRLYETVSPLLKTDAPVKVLKQVDWQREARDAGIDDRRKGNVAQLRHVEQTGGVAISIWKDGHLVVTLPTTNGPESIRIA